jgi:hypothetical protein
MAAKQGPDIVLGVDSATLENLQWYIDFKSGLYEEDEIQYFAEKREFGDFSYRGFLPESRWNRRIFTQGSGHRLFNENISGRYHSSNGIDATRPGDVIKGPLGNAATFSTAAAMISVPVEFNGSLWAASGSRIYESTDGGASYTVRATLAGTIQDLVVVNDWATDGGDYMLAAQGEGAPYEFSANGTSWTASNLSGDLGLADYFAVIQDRVYKVLRTTDSSPVCQVYHSTNPQNSGVTWTSLGHVGQPEVPVQFLRVFDDSLLVGKEDGIYTYKADGTFTHLLDFTQERSSENCQAYAVGADGNFYFNIGNNVIRFNGQTAVNTSAIQSFTEIGLSLNEENTSSAKGTPQKMLWAFGRLWVTVRNASDQYFLLCYNPRQVSRLSDGWHTLYNSGTTALGIIGATGLGTRPHLILRHGTSTLYLIQANRDQNPREDLSYRYSLADQNMDTEGFDAGLPDIPKTFLSMHMSVIVPANTRIDVSYDLDASGSFVALESITATGINTTMEFPTNTEANCIELRFTLVSSDNTATPVLRGFTMSYKLRPEVRREWKIPLLLHPQFLTRPARAISNAISELRSLRQTAFPVTFTDMMNDQFNVTVEKLGPFLKVHRPVGMEPSSTVMLHLQEFTPSSGAWYVGAENALVDVAFAG